MKKKVCILSSVKLVIYVRRISRGDERELKTFFSHVAHEYEDAESHIRFTSSTPFHLLRNQLKNYKFSLLVLY